MKYSPAAQPDRFRGFTLAEMLIAMGIFSMVIAAMVALQIFGKADERYFQSPRLVE